LRFETKPANQSQLISLPMLALFCLFLSLFLLSSHFLDACFCVQISCHSTASLATGCTDSFTGRSLCMKPSAMGAHWSIVAHCADLIEQP